ncbi:murein L,D-transpeptidase catalytic domain-containing protein [Sphingomicrobium astaxanthinifaciens]|uniref:murein L,D-transpeptidase catalytic domain-containing protein n=1 Tax=Sphingomicrobium astaxanthinifaciens TaxID=1227949 RepID=UPI001FCC18FF|nr:murein L,D-transpeptidase catalytic domain family protein [Sphingomicrobium astaxanthinifaciens]MCJ7421006.1 murein L,D-transpeptidase catalytic domain family protein [Sphingomicrobium astaxanthinifaciens]
MELGRRHLLKGLAAGAAGVCLPGAAAAQPALRIVTPRRPVSFWNFSGAPAGVEPALFAKALAALEQHRGSLRHHDRIGIVDYSRHSADKRFHIVDLASGQAQHFRVTHGSGSDRSHNGYLDQFSNRHGSHASSQGAYATASQYHGKYGLSMKLAGLDFTNSNAMSRYIVMHAADYAEPHMVRRHGKLGRSQGCFACARRDHWQAMNLLGDGRLLYADKLA